MNKASVCKQIQEVILDALNNDRVWTTAAVLLIRMGVGVDRVRERLVRAMERKGYNDALFVICETGYASPEIVLAIQKVLQSGETYEMTLATRALGMVGSPEESRQCLHEVVKYSEFPCAKIEGIRAIRKLSRYNIDGIEAVSFAMEHSSSAEVRICAAITLASWDIIPEYAIDELVEQEKEKINVLLVAAKDLADIGRKDKAVKILLNLLTTSHQCSQWAMVEALRLVGELGTEYATVFAPVLRALIESETDWEVSVEAIKTLGRLQCRDRETVALLQKIVTQDKGKKTRALNTLLLLGEATVNDLAALEGMDDSECCVALNKITRDRLPGNTLARVVKRLREATGTWGIPMYKSILSRLGVVECRDFDDLLEYVHSFGVNENALMAMSDLWFALECRPG